MEPRLKQSSNDENGESMEGIKKRKTMPNTSFIWDHFQRGVEKKNIMCIHCLPLGATTFAYSGGTSTMTRHLRRKHGIFAPGKSEQDFDRQIPNSSSTGLSIFDKSDDGSMEDRTTRIPMRCYKTFPQSRSTSLWIKYVTLQYAPLEFDRNIQALFKKVNCPFQPHTGETAVTALMDLMRSQSVSLQHYFESTLPAISLSVHEWKGQNFNVIVITAHWITSDFELRQCVLDTIFESSVGVNEIITALQVSLTRWKLQSLLHAITVPQKFHTPVLIAAFPTISITTCLFDQLNTVMHAILNSHTSLLTKARKEIIREMNSKGDESTSVCLDQSTCWWSSVEMLQQEWILKQVRWSDDEKKKLDELVSIVRPAYRLLKQTSSISTPPLASLVFSLLHGITKLLARNTSAKPFLPMFQRILQTNPMMSLVCLMDPRFKGLPFLQPEEKQRSIQAIQNATKKNSIVTTSVVGTMDLSTPSATWSELYPFEDACTVSPGDMQMYMDATTLSDLIDPLAWWKVHRHVYPDLATIARKYLSVSPSASPIDEMMAPQVSINKLTISSHLIGPYIKIRSALQVPELE